MAKNRSTRAYVDDLFTSIGRLEEYIRGIDKDAMIADYRILDGIERNLEKISEATRQGIPQVIRDTVPNIPWKQIEDIGNVLRHAYHNVNPDVLWETANSDIPQYKAVLERIRELDLESIDATLNSRSSD